MGEEGHEEIRHRPVLVDEVVELLAPAGDLVVDATVGGGGHSEALLEAGVAEVLGFDRDSQALERARARLVGYGGRFRPFAFRFSHMERVLAGAGVRHVGGILLDLGVSSMQLEEPDRGFAYRSGGPLDMRMGPAEVDSATAAEIVNSYSEEQLTELIGRYGEDRFARRIARAILRSRSRSPILTTNELAAVVAAAVPRRRGGPHPARRTFQALRIEVNEELEELAACLPQAARLLRPGGRLVVISYHSLEDRIVKRFLAATPSLVSLSKRPIRPSTRESSANPRARSARLRAAERVDGHAA